MASLKYKLNKKIDTMWRYKESKHQIKKDIQAIAKLTGEKITNRADGIFSKNTMKGYKDSVMKFASYIQKNHKEIKNIQDISKEDAHEYLEYLYKEKHERPGTIQTRAAGIAKVLNWTTTDINYDLPTKNSVDPIKGRNGTNSCFSIKNHQDIIDYVKNTGCRKTEMQLITPDQIKEDKNGHIYLDFLSKREYQVQTKGGRGRIINKISNSYQEVLKKLRKNAKEKNFKTVFQQISKSAFQHANVHQYRREYAQNLYKTLEDNFHSKNGYYAKNDYFCRGKHLGESYNRNFLHQVSEQLGHNRVDVVVNNYFR